MQENYLPGKNKIFYKKNKFDSKKKTLVFVHGLSGSSSAWIPYEKKFEKKFNVFTFDLRGHGKSFRPENVLDYSIGKFSEDLYSLIKHEKISNFILIGHSFGNFVILDFLKKHQKIVRSVIFISADYAPSKRRLTRAIIPIFSINHLPNYFSNKKHGNHIDYSNYVQTGDWNLRRICADVKNTGIKSFVYSTKSSYHFNAENFLSKIKVPVLIIHGKKDTIFPVTAAIKMASMIKNCKVKIINEADHILPLNHFNKLSKEIENFARNS